ncbi:MAG: carotenoid 1,2-hydratase [Methylacidiphilales bacterium]|nr:carotenoid 1,2-hydratase [Candidatus Methylacidiphilales bacterium]
MHAFIQGLAVAFLLGLGLPLRANSVPNSNPAPDIWQRAIGPWAWSFPRDHGAHPCFKTEWWYFTGNLQDGSQRKFGYQLTIFRQGIQFTPAQAHSQWAVRDFYFGHFTISDIAAGKFHVAERVTRGALGEAKAATGHMDVALGPWSITQDDHEQIRLSARDSGSAIDFIAKPLKPIVLEGVNGLSRKADGPGQASYYYSYPRLATTGRLRVGDTDFTVSGLSWFDHEFSTSSLGPKQAGWDWFCLQLDNHEEIMLYAMRDLSGSIDPVSEGTWVRADGTSERLVPGSFSIAKLGAWRSPATGAVYPAGWRIEVPGHHADFTVSPAMADQELHLAKMGALDYWEGACTIRGTLSGAAVAGAGYTELTGYTGALQAGLKE